MTKSIKKYIANKKAQCKDTPKRDRKRDRNGIAVEWNLSEQEVYDLLEEAGITKDDIGPGKGKYCLARIKDLGDYEVDNARFITNEENSREFRESMTAEELAEHDARAGSYGHLGAKYGILGWTTR